MNFWLLKMVWAKRSVEKNEKLQPWPMSFTSSTDLNWLLPSRLLFLSCQMITSGWNHHVILIKHKPFFAIFTAFFNSALFDFRSFWSLKKEIPTLKIYTMITVFRPLVCKVNVLRPSWRVPLSRYPAWNYMLDRTRRTPFVAPIILLPSACRARRLDEAV